MTHDELVWDLANTFDLYQNAVFMESRLGSSWRHGGVPIPDLFVMNKSYNRANIRIYEVKASTQDLSGDIKRGKWEKYCPYANKIYFALGPKIKDWKKYLEHQPVGVMVRGKKGWRTVKPAPVREREKMSEEVLLGFFMHGKHLQGSKRHDRIEVEKRILEQESLYILRRSVWKRLSEKADELAGKERSLENLANDARKEIYNEIRERLNLSGSWRNSIDEFLHDLLVEPVKKSIVKFLEYQKEGNDGN